MPELIIGNDKAARTVRMTAAGDGTFIVTFERVQESFPYAVAAGPSRSDTYAIEVIRPARVARIDLRYRYPEGLGLPPRVDEDGGDIFGPSGTTVDLTIVTDKPITRGALTLGGRQSGRAGG